MAIREIDRRTPAQDEDWEGNNAAFSCPVCGKVFIVSEMLHRAGRECPSCRKSKATIQGGRLSGGSARIEW